jgi:hypothetical protein
VATPKVASPGEVVELTFPTELTRGAPWHLSKWDYDEWSDPLYLVIASQPNGYNADGPDWQPRSDLDSWGWEDIGLSGPGPEEVVIPESARAGEYRFCTANAGGGPYCVNVSVDA